jgi:hypothetical protein
MNFNPIISNSFLTPSIQPQMMPSMSTGSFPSSPMFFGPSQGSYFPSFGSGFGFPTTGQTQSTGGDIGDASGLNEFQRVSTRLWGHDILDNGKNDGSVLLETLLNPVGSGNTAFWKSPQDISIVAQQLIMDITDDGQINGSSLRHALEQTYWQTTGHDISGALESAPNQAADLSANAIFAQQPDMTTPDGLAKTVQNTGLSTTQLLNLSLWGHDTVDDFGPYGLNIDGSVLAPALNNQQSIDWGFVNSMPETKQYTQSLIDRDKQNFGQVTGNALNTDFLSNLQKIYNIPGQLTGNV